MKNNIMYLFQSRPVTNLESYTEWKLSHVLDSGHNDQNEYNTRANAGEVMPGTVSHLFITIFTKIAANIALDMNFEIYF